MTPRLRRALVAGTLAAGAGYVAPAVASAQVIVAPPDARVIVFVVPRVSFEQLLAVPEVRALARSGGAALMSSRASLTQLLREAFPGMHVSPLLPNLTGIGLQIERNSEDVPLEQVGRDIRSTVRIDGAERLTVIVATDLPSPAMLAAKDELTPIVMATGSPSSLFPSSGPLHTLESDTTRRTGVVSDLDVVPTILNALGRPVPSGIEGSGLRVVDSPAPFELHERHLANRRMSVPVPTAAGIYVALAGLFAIAVLARRRRVPRWLGRLAGWLALTVPLLAVGLLAAGRLPTLSYATVVPFVIAVTLAGTLVVVPLQRFGTIAPPAAIGAAVLTYFAIEAALGWTAALTPFLGGSELDGGRFYGLPNEFIGLLLGASLYLVARWEPWKGFVLIVTVAFFAGLPGIGANLGGSIALFAAAGLWLALRARGRLGWKEVAFACTVVVVGIGMILLAHRFLTSTPTHITRFVETGGGIGGVWRTLTDRLLVGWRLIERNPFALIPALGVPASLLAVLRPAAPVREAFARQPEWRDAILVILLASAVAYVANDSGAAACGLGFGLGLGGLLYVSCAEQTWKMDAA